MIDDRRQRDGELTHIRVPASGINMVFSAIIIVPMEL
jgi:hypothetical protein